jgi:hypothetical protein
MMASDDKKVKTNPAQKNEAPPKSKGTSVFAKRKKGRLPRDCSAETRSSLKRDTPPGLPAGRADLQVWSALTKVNAQRKMYIIF